MAPPSFNDFAGDSASLFDDHHGAGQLKFSQKVGNFDLSASAAHGSSNVDWDLSTSMHGMDIKYDSSSTITKSLDLAIKQVEGLKLNWESSFSCASGLDLGSLSANFSNDNVNLNIKSSLDAAPALEFDVAAACNKLNANVGVKGSFSVKDSALGPIGWGLNANKGNVQVSFLAENVNAPLSGVLHVFQKLPDNKDFCCYGVQANTSTGELAWAAASSCCDKNTMRYKLNHTGELSVAKVTKLNKSAALNLSASLNLKDLSAGGHSFGAGVSFE